MIPLLWKRNQPVPVLSVAIAQVYATKFMITKNHEGMILPMIIKRLILDGFATIPFLLSGQFSHIWALLQAHISFYKYLPEMIEKRRAFIREHDNHFNRVGMYKKSIILDRFLFRKTKFIDLNSADFY